MNPKDNVNNNVKKYLVDADIPGDDQGAALVVRTLFENPDVIVRHEPPAGYEERLLMALREKLPEDKAQDKNKTQARNPELGAARPGGFLGWMGDFLRSPQISWGLTGAMALFMAVFSYTLYNRPDQSTEPDLLAKTAEMGGENLVNNWLASVGDSAIRARSGDHSLQALVSDLEGKNEQAVDQALEQVAAAMGLKL